MLEQFVKSGYLTNLSIEKIFDQGLFARFDVKLVLADDWEVERNLTSLRFIDACDIRLGDGREGINLGAQILLVISDISSWGWDGVRFKVGNDEQDATLLVLSSL